MILREDTLTAQETLLTELERAFDEQILKEFISDYVGWVGKLEDVYEAQKLSDKIDVKDIDNVVNELKVEGLLKEDAKSPYKQLCDICLELHRESPDLVIDNVNDCYFAHVGDKGWDDAYDSFVTNYTKDPQAFYNTLLQEGRSLHESVLNEFLKPTRLTTVGKILGKAKDELESDEYNKKLKFYQAVASALKVKDVNKVLVYTQDKNTLATLIRDNLPKTKLFATQKAIQLGDIKGNLYSDWGMVLTSGALFFKDEGSFRQLDKFLDGSRDKMPLEDEDDIETVETDAEEEVTREPEADLLAEEIIHLYKTKSGNYYAKVAQAPEVERERDFTDPNKCLKYAQSVLAKKGFNAKDFKVEKHYNTDPEVKTVEIGGKKYNSKDIAFVVDGRAYSYARWNALDSETKAKAVAVARKGLLNKEVVEDVWSNFGDARTLLEGVIVQLPAIVEVEFDGPEYMVTNKETDNYARGYVVCGDQSDKDDYIYNVCSLCSPVCRKDELLNSINGCLTEDFESDANLMTVEELLTAMFGNVPEEQIDEEIKRFRKYANLLGMKSSDYDKLVCLVDDELDPVAVFDGARNISREVRADYKVNFYPEQAMIVEYVNGNVYMFFKDEADCRKYYTLADKFLRSFDVDENPFDEDFTINKDAINIEECLNTIDKSNNNEFDLLNCYLENVHSAETNAKLASMIREEVSPAELRKFITGKRADLFEDADEDITIEEFLEEATSVSDEGTLTVTGEETLNRACNWLDNNGVEYHTAEEDSDSNKSVFTINWNKKNSVDVRYSDEQNAENKGVAMKTIEKLNEIKEYLNEICNSTVATYVAASYDLEIQDLLREALELVSEFKY